MFGELLECKLAVLQYAAYSESEVSWQQNALQLLYQPYMYTLTTEQERLSASSTQLAFEGRTTQHDNCTANTIVTLS